MRSLRAFVVASVLLLVVAAVCVEAAGYVARMLNNAAECSGPSFNESAGRESADLAPSLSNGLLFLPLDRLVVQTDKGTVEGFTSGGVNKWRGVPYATARRFAVPEAYPAWSGVRQTTQPAPICPQLQLIPGIWSGSEDCLYADIYAPQNLTKPAAVLVWIYGGGWIFGDALEFGLYDATNLVKEHNVVVVSVSSQHNHDLDNQSDGQTQ
jgi:hypothetical protein